MENEAKNPFENFELSDDAIKLANAIYNTYLLDKYPYLHIPVNRLCGMFGLDFSKASTDRLREIFEELNEPIVVTNFQYGSKVHDWTVLQFCEFEKNWEDGDAYIDIYLEEMYVEAIKRFMEKPFINIR